ncbi:metallophosphoesterase family protein [Corynebacterium uterequi]|uniref:Nuclease SbcCD subunit D n=1 Tax=Corynebacterium uterequi TaxID=1072256 RepID=A0A0G3HC33_9CORY|nr:DNA repair exonuclease [Corynebacterium uterequi]AKK10859.1 DNA repair exonuclease [Corynebacterium uterequi]
MTEITFIHTSDLQMGMRHRRLGEEQGVFDNSRLRAIDKLGHLAREQGAAFIVVAGDVFDANSLDRKVTSRVTDALSALEVPVYLLPGNHDPLVAGNIFKHTEPLANVHVIRDSVPQTVADGVELVGAPLLTKHSAVDLVREALEPLTPSATIRIAVGHGAVEAFGDASHPNLIDLGYVEERIADGTIDYLALGDTHSTRQLGESGRTWYSGAPETTDFRDDSTAGGGESDSGNALVVTLTSGVDGRHATVVKHRIGEWTFDALAAELNSRADVDAWLSRLRAYPAKNYTMIKYSLTGVLSLRDREYLDAEMGALAPSFASFYERVRLHNLLTQPTPEELDALAVGAVTRAAVTELASDDDPVAHDALNLMYRLMKEVER